MAGPGQRLKSEREARGISLEEIAATTRISVRLLQAIEGEQLHLLPGGIFNTSFVRQYARSVGLDEDYLVAEFRKIAPSSEFVSGEGIDNTRGGELVEAPGARLAESVTDYFRRYRTALSAACAALAFVALGTVFYSWRGSEDVTPRGAVVEPRDAVAPPGDSTEERSNESSLPEASDPETDVVSPVPLQVSSEPKPASPIRVELKITDTVWVRAAADGQRVLEDILRAGETKSISANDSVRLIVGNAGGLTVALNGETMPPIGPPGRVRWVVLTPSGMKITLGPKKSRGGSSPPSNDPEPRQTSSSPGEGPPVLARAKQ